MITSAWSLHPIGNKGCTSVSNQSGSNQDQHPITAGPISDSTQSRSASRRQQPIRVRPISDSNQSWLNQSESNPIRIRPITITYCVVIKRSLTCVVFPKSQSASPCGSHDETIPKVPCRFDTAEMRKAWGLRDIKPGRAKMLNKTCLCNNHTTWVGS